MAITKENAIVVYRLSDLDSAQFAAYYADKHNLKTTSDDPSGNSGVLAGRSWEVHGQLVGIECSNSEILSSETEFNQQVLNLVAYAINNSIELTARNVWCIVIGYNVPGAFISGSDVIAATARLSRIHHAFDPKLRNKLFNRSVFQRFDSDDADIALICSRIDGPNVLFAQDPYSDVHEFYASEYEQDIIDFRDDIAPTLNLDTNTTTFLDPYLDETFPYVEDESFVWSWFADRATNSFFKSTTALRVFFYNADFDGAYTVRNESGDRWPFLALNNNYVATAGAFSDCGVDAFLNPSAFFTSLLKGATIGEAFLFSSPYNDWTVGMFGDPLTYCSFPGTDPVDEDEIGEHEVWRRMTESLGRANAHFYQKGIEIREVVDSIVELQRNDTDVELDLLYQANNLLITHGDGRRLSDLKGVTDALFEFPMKRYFFVSEATRNPYVNEYCTDHGYKLSRLLTEVSSSAEMEDDNLYDQGWWRFEFTVQDDTTEFVYYHFTLEVSDKPDFSNILYTKDSYSVTNWTYEKEKDTFVIVPFQGVSTSYIGRRVRYESRYDTLLGVNEYLTRGETYYFRITQYNAQTSTNYSSRSYGEIIFT